MLVCVLVSIITVVPGETSTSTCITTVRERSANLTCTLTTNTHPRDVTAVTLLKYDLQRLNGQPDPVMECFWFSGKADCHGNPSYVVNTIVTDQLIVSIPLVTEEHEGDYECRFVTDSADLPTTEGCRITLPDDIIWKCEAPTAYTHQKNVSITFYSLHCGEKPQQGPFRIVKTNGKTDQHDPVLVVRCDFTHDTACTVKNGYYFQWKDGNLQTLTIPVVDQSHAGTYLLRSTGRDPTQSQSKNCTLTVIASSLANNSDCTENSVWMTVAFFFMAVSLAAIVGVIYLKRRSARRREFQKPVFGVHPLLPDKPLSPDSTELTALSEAVASTEKETSVEVTPLPGSGKPFSLFDQQETLKSSDKKQSKDNDDKSLGGIHVREGFDVDSEQTTEITPMETQPNHNKSAQFTANENKLTEDGRKQSPDFTLASDISFDHHSAASEPFGRSAAENQQKSAGGLLEGHPQSYDRDLPARLMRYRSPESNTETESPELSMKAKPKSNSSDIDELTSAFGGMSIDSSPAAK